MCVKPRNRFVLGFHYEATSKCPSLQTACLVVGLNSLDIASRLPGNPVVHHALCASFRYQPYLSHNQSPGR